VGDNTSSEKTKLLQDTSDVHTVRERNVYLGTELRTSLGGLDITNIKRVDKGWSITYREQGATP